MDFIINSQTKEIIDNFNITDEQKDFIFQHIEDAYYKGHTDGYLDGYSSGYEEGHYDGYYVGRGEQMILE